MDIMADILPSLGMNKNMLHSGTTFLMAREQVFGDDDLLSDILLRMPIKSIYKSRFVSKRWNTLISSILFLDNLKATTLKKQERLPRILNFMLAPPPSMHFHLESRHENNDQTSGCCSSCENVHTPSVISGYEIRCFLFRCSSNSLILTASCDKTDTRYRVVNLETKESVQLPHLDVSLRKNVSHALVYEVVESHQAMSPSFKVVVAPAELDVSKLVDFMPVLPILIYSSHTGVWTKSCMRSQQGVFSLKCFKPPVSLNGFLHWYCDPWGIAIMDTKNMVNRTKMIDIELIPLPHIPSYTMEPFFNFGFTRTSCNDLWFGAIDEWATLRFWRLSMGKHSNNISRQIGVEEWILMESVDIVSLVSSELSRLLCTKCNNNFHDFSNFGGVVKIEALIPWGSDIIVLLRLHHGGGDVAFAYNRQSKSLELICCYEWDDLTRRYDLYGTDDRLDDLIDVVDDSNDEVDDHDDDEEEEPDVVDDVLGVPGDEPDVVYDLLGFPDDEPDLVDEEPDDPYDDEELRAWLSFCGWSPIMEPLMLSSYGSLKHKPPSIWRCLACSSANNCEECSLLLPEKIHKIKSKLWFIFLCICAYLFIWLCTCASL